MKHLPTLAPGAISKGKDIFSCWGEFFKRGVFLNRGCFLIGDPSSDISSDMSGPPTVK